MFLNDYTLKIITGESGYFFKTDEHPIQLVEADCEPGRALCITDTKRIAGVKIRLKWQYGKIGEKVASEYFELYWLPTVGRNEMTGAELVNWYFWYRYGDEQ